MDDEDERSEQVRGALVRGLVALLTVAVVIALGTVLLVRTLGLDEGESTGTVGSAPAKTSMRPSGVTTTTSTARRVTISRTGAAESKA